MRDWTCFSFLQILLFCFLATICLPATAQTGNACGVVARLTPGNDSVCAVNTLVAFTSTSTNATSLQWFVNGFNFFNPTPLLNYVVGTGTTEVMLVASNGACTDTARVTYFCPGTPYNTDSLSVSNYGFSKSAETPSAVDDTREGGFVIGGTSRIFTMPNFIALDRAYVVKTKPGGCVEWSRMINDTKGGSVEAVLGCADSSVLVSGGYYGGGFFLTRFDKSGTRLWQKSYSSRGNGLALVKLAEDRDGSVYGLTNWADIVGAIKLVKLDAGGNVVWTRAYNFTRVAGGFSSANGLTVVNQQVYISGSTHVPGTNGQTGTFKNFVIRVDGALGQTVWAKEYIPAIGTSFFQGIQPYGSQLMVSATASAYNNRIGHSVIILNDAGSFVRGTTILHQDNINNNFSGYFSALGGVAEADTALNIYLLNFTTRPLSLQPNIATASYFLKLDSSFALQWGRGNGGQGTRQYTYAAVNNRNEWGCVAPDFGLVEQTGLYTLNYRLQKIKHSPPGSTGCSADNNGFDFLPLQYTQADIVPAADSSVGLTQRSIDFPFDPVYSESRYACPDFIDSCVLLKVSGPAGGCNLSQTYTYKVFRNKKCNLPVRWQTSGGATVITQNDSLITVKFPAFGTYSVSATLLSPCNPRKDSVVVMVYSRTPPLQLGPDKLLCPGNVIKLTAGPKFLSYLWQDGSVDSVFTAVQAGTYWVKVTDSCGNVLSDTIQVMPAPPVSFNAGVDRTKCNTDTIHLSAPAGFINYSWSNNYNISSTTAQNVVVNPMVDTAYYIRAEKTPGCFAYDTVRITVNHSPAIDLGNDKSFCLGDSVVFNAGSGFQNYQWNNGGTLQRMVAKTVAQYSVIATTAEGCKSFDTVKVVGVYALPVVSIDKSTGLCTGSTRLLNAGSFSSYQWSTGATSQAINVSTIGKYLVTVTDANGCKGSDSSTITTMYSLPSGFLQGDTAVCSYGTLELKPATSFNNYTWSNGAHSSSIVITQPGMYWLEVTDNNICKGRDSVQVDLKQCLSGFYIPTAFTPNSDGRNDLFQPLLFGRVKKYQFAVYNRWGEIIFQTAQQLKGWDGKVSGMVQQTGVFVWTCTYQFEGEVQKIEKGTVTLIR